MHQPTGSGGHQPLDHSFSTFPDSTPPINLPAWGPSDNWNISATQVDALHAALTGQLPVPNLEDNDERAFFHHHMHQHPTGSITRQPVPFPAQYGTLPLEQVQAPAPAVAMPQTWTAVPAGNRDPNAPPIVQKRLVPATPAHQATTPAPAFQGPSGPPSAPSMEHDGFEVVSSELAVHASQSQSHRKRKTSQSGRDDARSKKSAGKKTPAEKKKSTGANNEQKSKKGGVAGRKRFKPEEDSRMLDFYETRLPGGGLGLKGLPDYMKEHGFIARDVSSYKRRFDTLVGVLKPTGNPTMAPVIERAKRLELEIGDRTGAFEISDSIPYNESGDDDGEEDGNTADEDASGEEDDGTGLYERPTPAPPLPTRAQAVLATERSRSSPSPSVPSLSTPRAFKRDTSITSDSSRTNARTTSAALLSGLVATFDPKVVEERRAVKAKATEERDERRAQRRNERDDIQYYRGEVQAMARKYENMFEKYETVKKERDELQNKLTKLEVQLILVQNSGRRRRRSYSRSRSYDRRSRSPSRRAHSRSRTRPGRRGRSQTRRRSRSSGRRSRSHRGRTSHTTPRRHSRSQSVHGSPQKYAAPHPGSSSPCASHPSLIVQHEITVTPRRAQHNSLVDGNTSYNPESV